MKRNNYNMIFKLGLLFSLVIIAGTSCIKSRPGATDFTGLQPFVLIPEGGLQNFGSEAILASADPDTSFFHLNYASVNVAPSDETIGFAFDPTALAEYNATVTNPLDTFAVFPDSIFSFTPTSGVVPKGASYSDGIPFVIFPSKIDPTKNYMYPITITTAPTGSTISSNFKTIYYHLIGNPIAGNYNDLWQRWNTPNVPPNPPSVTSSGPSSFAPMDGTTVTTAPDGTGAIYIITFDNNAGVLSNFQVALDPASVAGITVTSGPTIVQANPATGTYEFTFNYLNAALAARVIDDVFTKQ